MFWYSEPRKRTACREHFTQSKRPVQDQAGTALKSSKAKGSTWRHRILGRLRPNRLNPSAALVFHPWGCARRSTMASIALLFHPQQENIAKLCTVEPCDMMILAINQPQARRWSRTSCPTIQGDLVLLLHELQQASSSPQRGRYGSTARHRYDSDMHGKIWTDQGLSNSPECCQATKTCCCPACHRPALQQTDTFCGDKPTTWPPTGTCLKHTPRILTSSQNMMINWSTNGF